MSEPAGPLPTEDVRARVDQALGAWRRKATDAFTLVTAAVHFVIVVPFILGHRLGLAYAVLAALAWVLTLGAAVLRHLSVSWRVWLLAGSVGVYAGAMLARGGVFLSFRPVLLVFPMVVVMLAGVRRGLAVGLAHVVFAALAFVATEAGWLPQAPPAWTEGEWMVQSASTIGLALPSLLLLAWFGHYLTTTIRRESVAALRLRVEAADRERLEGEVLEAGERESRRIGNELHDGVCQDLTGLLIRAKRSQKALEAEGRPEAEALGVVVQGLGDAIGEIHDLSRRLSPGRLTGQDLAGALGDLVRRTAETAEPAITFLASGEGPELDAVATLHLFRITQEALANAVRHAGASRVEVRLAHDAAGTVLSVDDDGAGLQAGAGQRPGLGLDTMRWRARKAGGTLTVSPRASGGTRVECRVPRAVPRKEALHEE